MQRLVVGLVLWAGQAGCQARLHKLGAYVMQAAETSPVRWAGRTLLVQSASGNTPGLYGCCSCRTYGCVANRSAPVGYADCSQCKCSEERRVAVGSCAPQVIQLVDYATLGTLLRAIPGSEGFGMTAATVHQGVLYVYGTNLVNRTNGAATLSCFASSDPTSAASWTRRQVLTVPTGFDIFNTDVHRVTDRAAGRRHVMVIETNLFRGRKLSWTAYFAETNASTPDRGWGLVDPDRHYITEEQMTACPSIRFYDGWYYVATTTEGPPCPSAGWANSSALCVVLYRSQTLRSGSWVMGNRGQPILFPGPDDRRVHPAWRPTAAERDAVSHGPQDLGDINNSDFDFCDTDQGVLGIFGGIANQKSNPYFNIAAIAPNTTSASWLASYFPKTYM